MRPTIAACPDWTKREVYTSLFNAGLNAELLLFPCCAVVERYRATTQVACGVQRDSGTGAHSSRDLKKHKRNGWRAHNATIPEGVSQMRTAALRRPLHTKPRVAVLRAE